jgi:hypothetical protein
MEGTMSDLAVRLRAVIEERRLTATSLQRRAQEHSLEIQKPELLGRFIPGWYEWPDVERLAADAILAAERDLWVLERHAPSSDIWYCNGPHGREGDEPWPCRELLRMATRYGIEVE